MKMMIIAVVFSVLGAVSGFASDYMVVRQLLGDVEYKIGGGRYQPVRGIGFRLEQGATIRTGRGAFVELAFSSDSGSTVALRDAATMQISEILSARKSALYLHTGRFSAIVSSALGGGFSVRTDTAVVGVRGTEFMVHAKGSWSTDVVVTKGVVEVTSVVIKDKKLVRAGEAVRVSEEGIRPAALSGVEAGKGLEEE
jgi:hypothetical protein